MPKIPDKRLRFFKLSFVVGVELLIGYLAFALVGCQAMTARRLTPPVDNRIVRDQLIVYSDKPLPARHRLLDELTALREQVTGELGMTRSDEPIHVHLFDTADEFRSFMQTRYPGLPDRRAFFIESDTKLAVYAHWGDRVAEDLRHEVSHGYMHSVVPAIPLWLDEGLAEFFEVPRADDGLNRPHVDHLLHQLNAGWRPNLQRLESLREAGDMAQIDYAESWAWAHLMLRTAPQRRDLLRWYLQDVRQHGKTEPLSLQLRRMLGQPEEILVAHIRELMHR